MAPVQLLDNLLSARPGVVDASALKRLQSAAMLDGTLDAAERTRLSELARSGAVDAAQRPGLDAWLAAPSNPEVAYVRKRSASFDARLAALTQHAQPGDLIFWRDPRPNSRLAEYLGEWSHVSLALGNGQVLDTMSLEGVSIATTEAVVSKVERRMAGVEVAIGRPKKPLTEAQLKHLRAAAHALQGRDYALLSPLKDKAAALSCSRSVYEALAAAGIELAPASRRLARNAVMTGDLMRQVKIVGTISEQGVFKAGKSALVKAWDITSWRKWVWQAGDALLTHVPSLWSFAEKYQQRALQNLRRL
ncbi:MAG: hypothetical protein VKP62_03850 [Candidatus Sericytochromatia bacterium]|nr:hypothetical protein [Candidatus Sericytochromatia bacterium]